ncbi:hypothetical protein HK405_002623, partial [Cladochytrium tenue]
RSNASLSSASGPEQQQQKDPASPRGRPRGWSLPRQRSRSASKARSDADDSKSTASGASGATSLATASAKRQNSGSTHRLRSAAVRSTDDLPSLPPRNSGGSSAWTPPAPAGSRFEVFLAHDAGGASGTSPFSSSATHDGLEPADDPRELRLDVGDRVVVLAWREDGWCYGRREAGSADDASPSAAGGRRRLRSGSSGSRRLSLRRLSTGGGGGAARSKGKERADGPLAAAAASTALPEDEYGIELGALERRGGGGVGATGWFPVVCVVPPSEYLLREKVEDVTAEEALHWVRDRDRREIAAALGGSGNGHGNGHGNGNAVWIA